MPFEVDVNGGAGRDVDRCPVGRQDVGSTVAKGESVLLAEERALYIAFAAACGARCPKRVSEAISLVTRRFGLKRTSTKSSLALVRRQGPAVRPPAWMAKGPSSCTETMGLVDP